MATKMSIMRIIPESVSLNGSHCASTKPKMSVAKIRDQWAITPSKESVSSSIPFWRILSILPVQRASIFS